MNYEIHLENFDGPMDLLLHFVKETKLDIYEIQMSSIIENYLNYINSLKNLNIDIGSDFLLMASSLLHLKSKMLIGKTQPEDETEDEFNITSEEDLKNKIIEYEKYKNVISKLQNLEDKRKEVYTKCPENIQEYQIKPELVNDGLTIDDLKNALLNVLMRHHYKEPVETRITKKEISVEKQMNKIRDVLKIRKKMLFEEFFDNYAKDYVIATFLALLEMTKKKEIILKQTTNFDSIEVEMI